MGRRCEQAEATGSDHDDTRYDICRETLAMLQRHDAISFAHAIP
ncbi:hypothetical protein [Novipirellula artificiosorum]|nr:hypothetical protein [Novipirellula artificiosorum]